MSVQIFVGNRAFLRYSSVRVRNLRDEVCMLVYRGLDSQVYGAILDCFWQSGHWDSVRSSLVDTEEKSRVLISRVSIDDSG